VFNKKELDNMKDQELKFTENYQINLLGSSEELCQLSFNVRQCSSESDDRYFTEVEVKHNGNEPLIVRFKFTASRDGGCKMPFIITDFMLPVSLRHHRLSMFLLHKAHGYLLDEIVQSEPRVTGSLTAFDSSPSRDRMYQRLIGHDVGHPRAEFTVDDEGAGCFCGVFLDVGHSWEQSINAVKI
jgi:hypothetical protein